MFCISLLVALITITCVPDPSVLQGGRFSELATFLNVFVGLLLGFFMSSSMARWYSSAEGFLILFSAVRNLQMQLFALGVTLEHVNECMRYGVLSCVLLNLSLRYDALPTSQKPRKHEFLHAGLQEKSAQALCDSFEKITPAEMSLIGDVEDPPGLIWMWVSQILGRLAQDGEVPPMPSPTYGRLLNIVQDAHSGIRTVKSSLGIHPPFIYVHMLAALVHINNLINALSFGLTLGIGMGTVAQGFLKEHLGFTTPAKYGEATTKSQAIVVAFFFSVVGPIIYQAILEVSIIIAQPFSSVDGEIPTGRLLQSLENDLQDGKIMKNNIPHPWEPPCFKKKG